MKPYLILITVFFFSLSIQAATVTWNGSFGFWNQANRWDTGQVPGPDDDVIIPGGFVAIPAGFFAEVKSLTVRVNTFLRIDINSTLRLANQTLSSGQVFLNRGAVFVFGTIELYNIQSTSSSATYRGLVNEGFFQTFNQATIRIDNINSTAIRNTNVGRFFNDGDIVSTLPVANWNKTILNEGRFENRLSGVVAIRGGTHGISNNAQNIHFRNRGKILIRGTEGSGLATKGTFRNFGTGSISLSECGLHHSDGTFTNEGNITISDVTAANSPSQVGMYNFDRFVNSGLLVLFNTPGLHNRVYAYTPSILPEFENSGYVRITDGGTVSIDNDHLVINTDEGHMTTDHRLRGSGAYHNDGIFHSWTTSNHFPNLVNNGIFSDLNGRLVQTNTVNNQLIVKPIPGPVIANQSVIPTFDLASYSNTLFGSWKDKVWGGDSCGFFIPYYNLFHPNTFAQDDADGSLWVELEVASSGLSDWFEVKMDASLPIQVVPDHLSSQALVREAKEKQHSFVPEITIYPNPASDYCRVAFPADLAPGHYQLSLLNANGQVVLQQMVTPVAGQEVQLPLSAALSSGMYWLRVQKDDDWLVTRRLEIVR